MHRIAGVRILAHRLGSASVHFFARFITQREINGIGFIRDQRRLFPAVRKITDLVSNDVRPLPLLRWNIVVFVIVSADQGHITKGKDGSGGDGISANVKRPLHLCSSLCSKRPVKRNGLVGSQILHIPECIELAVIRIAMPILGERLGHIADFGIIGAVVAGGDVICHFIGAAGNQRQTTMPELAVPPVFPAVGSTAGIIDGNAVCAVCHLERHLSGRRFADVPRKTDTILEVCLP